MLRYLILSYCLKIDSACYVIFELSFYYRSTTVRLSITDCTIVLVLRRHGFTIIGLSFPSLLEKQTCTRRTREQLESIKLLSASVLTFHCLVRMMAWSFNCTNPSLVQVSAATILLLWCEWKTRKTRNMRMIEELENESLLQFIFHNYFLMVLIWDFAGVLQYFLGFVCQIRDTTDLVPTLCLFFTYLKIQARFANS